MESEPRRTVQFLDHGPHEGLTANDKAQPETIGPFEAGIEVGAGLIKAELRPVILKLERRARRAEAWVFGLIVAGLLVVLWLLLRWQMDILIL